MSPILNLPAGFDMASLHFGGNGLPLGATVVFGFATSGGTDTPSAAATSIIALLTGTGGLFNPSNINFSNSCTFNDVLVKFGPLSTGPAATASSGTVLGNVGGDTAVPSVSCLINKSTALGGRHGRGRMFVPGLPEGVVQTGGFLLPGNRTSIQTAATKFFTDMGTAGRQLYLLHRYDPALGQTPMAPTILSSLDVQSVVATQRQRLRR